MAQTLPTPVKMAFENLTQLLAISDIQPLRLVPSHIRTGPKYAQIAASIREVGIIEPPVVSRDPSAPGKYLLLDGHLRIEILKTLGLAVVNCVISTDDEGFTYNKRINRLAIIQEHKMILKAIDRGVSEDRIAKALNIDIKTLQQKKCLLSGICAEAADLLKDKHVCGHVFAVLKKMTPFRQIEAAELMVTMNRFTNSYAKSLLAATPQDQLVDRETPKAIRGLSADQMTAMERESEGLEREFKIVEKSYGTDHLDFVLAKGFLAKLLRNARITRFLAQYHGDLLTEFQKITEVDAPATVSA